MDFSFAVQAPNEGIRQNIKLDMWSPHCGDDVPLKCHALFLEQIQYDGLCKMKHCMGLVHVKKASIQVPNGTKSDKQAPAVERLLFLFQ